MTEYTRDFDPFYNVTRKELEIFKDANCKGTDTEAFFIEKTELYDPVVKKICNRCSIKEQCLQFALKYKVVGFWGGTTEYQRNHDFRVYAA